MISPACHVLNSIKSSVGNKVKILFKNVVRLETKGDKTENRVLDAEHGGGVQYPFSTPHQPLHQPKLTPGRAIFYISSKISAISAAKRLSPPLSRMLNMMVDGGGQ
ncbi:hypothetical protein NQ318_022219 [Aromia moschata]|uniref:Uncharacterized protein n=1 Tax=Aromia moschata TaxID=1265417 RepID=A0AAV8XBY1_9CUCU|nr:hypothetical protein NQ318_022219 [Aromia moschata]